MTGWRLGWLLVPRELRRAVDCLTGNFTICPPVLSQYRRGRGVHPEADRRSRRPSAPLRRQPLDCCSTACATSASTGWHPPTARSTSTPTSRISPPTRWISAQSCWPTPELRSRRVSTSIPSTAARSSGCPSPDRQVTSKRRCAGWALGCRVKRAVARSLPRAFDALRIAALR